MLWKEETDAGLEFGHRITCAEDIIVAEVFFLPGRGQRENTVQREAKKEIKW